MRHFVVKQGRTAFLEQTKEPNLLVLLSELKAYSNSRNLQGGKRAHAKARETGVESNIYIASTLVSMYAKCGKMDTAREVFNNISHPNVVTWNAIISGYAANGDGATALGLFTRMRSQGCRPNSVTYIAALKACSCLAAPKQDASESKERGKHIHALVDQNNCDSDICVQNALIDMYAKCGSMVDARRVFDSMLHRDVVSWTALIMGYATNGEGVTALDLFSRMSSQGCSPNPVTFVAALKACTSLALKDQGSRRVECGEMGRQVHRLAKENGCDSDPYVQNTLIDMYAKCGSMADAQRVFEIVERPGVVSWTALILGYAENGSAASALELFTRMRSESCQPNSVTFLAALKACASLGGPRWLEQGRHIHTLACESGCDRDIYVQGALIDMYAKCGSMEDAQRVFNSVKRLDVVSWNVLILGYAENGDGIVALDMFAGMKSQGYIPDTGTFVAALKACALLGALDRGRKIHAEIERVHVQIEPVLVNCLVDFYAKCGSLVEAQHVFDSHPTKRDLTTWTSLLGGYSRLGDTKAVFGLFQGMQDAGLQPNGVTFTCVLSCCSHAGLVEKGRECFDTMSAKYGIVPGIEHYTCMVDILGRSNKLDDVMELLANMPCSPDAVTWMTLLDACRKWKNVELGILAFKSLLSLDDTMPGSYVLMAQIYRSRGMLEEQEMVLRMRSTKLPERFRKVAEEESWWTDEMGEVHKFLVGKFSAY